MTHSFPVMTVGTAVRITHRHTVKVRKGRVAIAIEDSGGSGPACVFIHGLGDCLGVWRLFVEQFFVDHRYLCVDLCGHGDSDWDAQGQYRASDLALDIREVLTTLDIQQAILVGHSLGGEVALELVKSLRHCIVGLVLVDYGPDSGARGSEDVRAQIRDAPYQFCSVEEYVEWLCVRRPLAQRDALRHVARHALRQSESGGFKLKLDRALGNLSHAEASSLADGWSSLSAVACPCLVIRGVGSAVLSQTDAMRMVEHALPNGSLITIARAGHAVMTDNPDGFARAAGLFLRALWRDR